MITRGGYSNYYEWKVLSWLRGGFSNDNEGMIL